MERAEYISTRGRAKSWLRESLLHVTAAPHLPFSGLASVLFPVEQGALPAATKEDSKQQSHQAGKTGVTGSKG